MNRKDITVDLVKIGLELASANWLTAAQGGLDLWSEASRSSERQARRAAEVAAKSLTAWAAAEKVPENELLSGVETAFEAVASPEELAELAARHLPNISALSDAILGHHPQGDAQLLIAHRVLDGVLEALLDEPDFRERLHEATNRGMYRETLHARDRAVEQRRFVEQAGVEMRRALSRHTSARAEALLSAHRERDFDNSLATCLREQLRPADQWRVEVTRQLDTLADVAMRGGRVAEANQLRSLPLEGPYAAVRSVLRRNTALILSVAELLDDDARMIARRAAAWLTIQIRNPTFRTAVLLTGRWGSGKSRLVGEMAAELAADVGAPDVVILRLLPQSGRSFLEAFLQEAGQALGRPVQIIDDFTAVLQASDAVGLVVVENLDRFVPVRSDLEDLIQTVADSTAADQLRWVLSVDSARLDRVLNEDVDWQEFTSAPPSDAADGLLAGWLDLDVSTVARRIGSRIVERELNGDAATETVARAELLDFPLNAWLHIDAVRGLGVAAASFEESFWSAVLRRLAVGDEEFAACVQLRRVIEGMFASTGGKSVSTAAVLSAAAAVSADPSDDLGPLPREAMTRALEVFNEAHLLAIAPEGRIDMRSPALWAVGVARRMAGHLGVKIAPLQAATTVQTFLRRCQPEFAEAVLMHLVGSLPWTSAYATRCEKLLNRIVTSPAIDPAGIWAAALLLGDEVHRSVVGALPRALTMTTNGTPSASEDVRRTPHEVYLLLRLCLRSDDDSWSFADRMSVVRGGDGFAIIGRNGLHPLMRAFIRHGMQVEDVATAEDRRLLLRLAERSERTLSAREYARTWVRTTVASAGTTETLAEVCEFFRNTPLDQPDDVPFTPDQGRRDDRAPFPAHLADAMASSVAADLSPLLAYRALQRARWLDHRAWPLQFFRILRSTTHVAVGYQFASDPDGIVGLVKDLIQGDAAEQESALFILRHTAPTASKRGVRLHPTLAPLLHKLGRRNSFSTSLRDGWLNPMLEANPR
ncbi:hypothetical protein [Curtobacterium sp. MCSS17_005]|uniref:hypothetical protein n=1 Tax=Curtobacterium sp. MCSS17_005 TaxID=2175641 RepID=UPI000DAA71CA|nr:hypothetical protein [Curtobacterium sp. MCSS17_005]WIB33060.1 hypothetical protein DEJ20_00985 [Curtobacterium sp. MCSS17_005]